MTDHHHSQSSFSSCPGPPSDPLCLKFILQLYSLFPDLLSQIRKELILFIQNKMSYKFLYKCENSVSDGLSKQEGGF